MAKKWQQLLLIQVYEERAEDMLKLDFLNVFRIQLEQKFEKRLFTAVIERNNNRIKKKKRQNLEHTEKWYLHKPEPHLDNSIITFSVTLKC